MTSAVIVLPRRRRLTGFALIAPILVAAAFAITGSGRDAPALPDPVVHVPRSQPAWIPNPDLAEALSLPIVDGLPTKMERVHGPYASLRAAIRAPYTIEAKDGDVLVIRKWPTRINGDDLLVVFRNDAGWWIRSLGASRTRSPVVLHGLTARDQLGPFDVGVTFEQWRTDPGVDVMWTVCRTTGTPSCATISLAYLRYDKPNRAACPEFGTTELCPHAFRATVDGDSVVMAGRHRDRVIHERRRIIWRR